MYSTSAAFKAAVRGSHTVAIQVDAYSNGTLIASDLQVESGSVTVSAASGVRRQLSLTVSDISVSPFGAAPISPYGVELHVARGITLLNGTTELAPLGVFRVESMTSPRDGEVQIVAPDRSAKIIDAKFLIPTMSDTAKTLFAQIAALVVDVYPSGVSVTNVDVPVTLVPWLLWDQERWDAIQKLATAVGAVCYFDVAGNVVLRLAPTIADTVQWYVNEGAQGVMIDASREITRAETYNVVVAVGERSDGITPARAVAEDDDPTSATYVDGPFGHVPFFFSSPFITTSGGATTVANALLARKRSLGRECTLSCVPNPALDVGDVIGVRFPDGSLERHVVDQLTIPLDATSPMQITTRTPDPYLVITDVPIPLSPIPDSYSVGPDYGTVTDYGTLDTPPAYDATPPGLYDGTSTPPLDTTPIPDPSPDPTTDGWYGDGHKVLGTTGEWSATSFDFSDYDYPHGLSPMSATVDPLVTTDMGLSGGIPWRRYSVTLHSMVNPYGHVPHWFVEWDRQAADGTWGGASNGYGTWNDPTNYNVTIIWDVISTLAPLAIRFKTWHDSSYEPPPMADFSIAAALSGETFQLHFVPQTVPEAIVKLDGTTLNPADNKYDIDYTTGIVTIESAMAATPGQIVTVQYKSDGTPTGSP